MANQYLQFYSTDVGAPVMASTTPGSCLGVLRACLVNGYGSKPSAGWTMPFTSTNLDVYQAPGGVQHYYQVTDTSVTAGVQSIFGFETMSAFNTGTGQFPTSGQAAAPSISKGTGATATWAVFADNRTCIFFGYNAAWFGTYFGELYSLLPNDSYRSLIRFFTVAGASDFLSILSNSIHTSTAATYMPRAYTGVGTSINMAATGDAAKSGSSGLLNGIIPFPDPDNGGLYLSPVWISDFTTAPVNGIRGRMRGFWHCLHPNTSINNLQIFPGVAELAGKSFIALKPTGDASNLGTYVVEISATLETN